MVTIARRAIVPAVKLFKAMLMKPRWAVEKQADANYTQISEVLIDIAP